MFQLILLIFKPLKHFIIKDVNFTIFHLCGTQKHIRRFVITELPGKYNLFNSTKLCYIREFAISVFVLSEILWNYYISTPL